MRTLIAFAVSSVVMTGGAAHAHEGHAHKLMGTITAVHADRNHVELTTADGKKSAFYVNKDTKYVKGSGAATWTDLKPGTRVVVETKMDGDKTIATGVKLPPGTKKSAAAGTHMH